MSHARGGGKQSLGTMLQELAQNHKQNKRVVLNLRTGKVEQKEAKRPDAFHGYSNDTGPAYGYGASALPDEDDESDSEDDDDEGKPHGAPTNAISQSGAVRPPGDPRRRARVAVDDRFHVASHTPVNSGASSSRAGTAAVSSSRWRPGDESPEEGRDPRRRGRGHTLYVPPRAAARLLPRKDRLAEEEEDDPDEISIEENSPAFALPAKKEKKKKKKKKKKRREEGEINGNDGECQSEVEPDTPATPRPRSPPAWRHSPCGAKNALSEGVPGAAEAATAAPEEAQEEAGHEKKKKRRRKERGDDDDSEHKGTPKAKKHKKSKGEDGGVKGSTKEVRQSEAVKHMQPNADSKATNEAVTHLEAVVTQTATQVHKEKKSKKEKKEKKERRGADATPPDAIAASGAAHLDPFWGGRAAGLPMRSAPPVQVSTAVPSGATAAGATSLPVGNGFHRPGAPAVAGANPVASPFDVPPAASGADAGNVAGVSAATSAPSGEEKRSRRKERKRRKASSSSSCSSSSSSRRRRRRKKKKKDVLPPDAWTVWPPPPLPAANAASSGLPTPSGMPAVLGPGASQPAMAASLHGASANCVGHQPHHSAAAGPQQPLTTKHQAQPPQPASQRAADPEDGSSTERSVCSTEEAPSIIDCDAEEEAAEPVVDDGYGLLEVPAEEAQPLELEPLVAEWPGNRRTVWTTPSELILPGNCRRTIARRRRDVANSPTIGPSDDSATEDGNPPAEPAEPPPCTAPGGEPPLVMPLWGRTLEWVEGLIPLQLPESMKRNPKKRKSTEFRRRARSRAALALSGDAPETEGPPPPNPAMPTAKSAGEAVADALNVARSTQAGSAAATKKNVKLVQWQPPPRIALPATVTVRDPSRYIGTEKAAREQRRLVKMGLAPVSTLPPAYQAAPMTVFGTGGAMGFAPALAALPAPGGVGLPAPPPVVSGSLRGVGPPITSPVAGCSVGGGGPPITSPIAVGSAGGGGQPVLPPTVHGSAGAAFPPPAPAANVSLGSLAAVMQHLQASVKSSAEASGASSKAMAPRPPPSAAPSFASQGPQAVAPHPPASAAPSIASQGPQASLISYTEALEETINILQADTAPPEAAVRSLWERLSPPDRQRFCTEFPQFMHYVPLASAPPSSKAAALPTSKAMPTRLSSTPGPPPLALPAPKGMPAQVAWR